MEEGVNQGFPLSSTLAVIVLHKVLAPLDAALKLRATTCHLNGCSYNNEAGVKTHPKAYVENTGASAPHQDVLFFLQEFQCLTTPLGCHLNPNKTCVMTLTSGTSSLLAIK